MLAVAAAFGQTTNNSFPNTQRSGWTTTTNPVAAMSALGGIRSSSGSATNLAVTNLVFETLVEKHGRFRIFWDDTDSRQFMRFYDEWGTWEFGDGLKFFNNVYLTNQAAGSLSNATIYLDVDGSLTATEVKIRESWDAPLLGGINASGKVLPQSLADTNSAVGTTNYSLNLSNGVVRWQPASLSGGGGGDATAVSYSVTTNWAFTNFVSITNCGVVAYNTNYFFTNGVYLATNTLTLSNGRRVAYTNGGYVVEKPGTPALLTNGWTNTTLIGTYVNVNSPSNPPTVFYTDIGRFLTTNIIVAGRAMEPAGQEDLDPLQYGQTNAQLFVAISFKGGDTDWPPNNADERGFLLTSPDGINWNGGTGRPLFDEPLRNGGFAKVGNTIAYVYSPHTAVGNVQWVGMRTTKNAADWTVKTNLSFACAGETLSTNARTWCATQPLAVLGTNVYCFASVSTNGVPVTNGNGVIYTGGGTFVQRVITCPTNLFPFGPWSAATQLDWKNLSGTSMTNVIDFNPIAVPSISDVLLYGIAKNETDASSDLYQVNVTNWVVSYANTGVSPNIGSEGTVIVKLPEPTNRFAFYTTINQYSRGGTNGQGKVNLRSSAGTLFGAPSIDSTALRVINLPDTFQDVSPFVLTDSGDVQNFSAVAQALNRPTGNFYLWGRFGEQWNGRLDRGMTSDTNKSDYAGYFVGTPDWPAGGMAVWRTNNVYHIGLGVASTNISDRMHPGTGPYIKPMVDITTNSVSFAPGVPVSGNFIGATNLNASNLASGTIPSARMGTTNAATNTTTSYSLVMHGTNPPVWANVLSNLTLVSPTVLGDLQFSGTLANADGKMRITNSLTLGGNTWGPALRMIGRTNDDSRSLYASINAVNLGVVGLGSTAGALWLVSGDANIVLRSGSTTIVDFGAGLADVKTNLLTRGSITTPLTITATNGFISSNLQPTTNGLGSQGGIIGCNGTNWWTVMRNSAGGLATNKLTLEAWP